MQVSHSLNHKFARELATIQVLTAGFYYHFMISWHF